MYKILSISAIVAGMLLLAPGAQAVPMSVDVAHAASASDAAKRGLQIASERANTNASFNTTLPPAAAASSHTLTQTKSAGTATAVPEPGTLGLLAAAVMGAAIVRRRRRGH